MLIAKAVKPPNQGDPTSIEWHDTPYAGLPITRVWTYSNGYGTRTIRSGDTENGIRWEIAILDSWGWKVKRPRTVQP